MSYALGIDLGGSSVKAVTVSVVDEVIREPIIEFDAREEMDWATRIRGLIRRLEQQRGSPATQIGLAAPGLADITGRAIAFMPGRLKGLEGLDWTTHLKCPSVIPVLNDAHAALLGERFLGAARGFSNVILFTLGTGVGGAAMVDGRLLRGHLGRAGHLGHLSLDSEGTPDICSTPGSLEDAIGNCTIQRRTAGRFESTHDLIAAQIAGDVEAGAVWLKAVRDLAAAVCSCINILDPEAVIIGGGIARAGPALFKPLEGFLEKMEWRPGGQRAKILPAQLGEFAGAIGAAFHARGII